MGFRLHLSMPDHENYDLFFAPTVLLSYHGLIPVAGEL